MDIVDRGIDTGKGYLKQGRGYLNQKMHNTMIQHSVFAAIVFLIVAHPKTFQLVGSVVGTQSKNVLLLIHAVVAGLIMYFGSLYLFEPVQRLLLGGVEGFGWEDVVRFLSTRPGRIKPHDPNIVS